MHFLAAETQAKKHCHEIMKDTIWTVYIFLNVVVWGFEFQVLKLTFSLSIYNIKIIFYYIRLSRDCEHSGRAL